METRISDLSYFPLYFSEKKEVVRGLSFDEAKDIDRLNCWIRDPSQIPERSPDYQLTIVWDLDQTLVSADGVEDEDPDDENTKLVIRPNAERVLIALRKNKDVEFIVWTAGTESHAKRVINSFQNVHFDYVISRNETWYDDIKQTKDLRIINRSLDTVVLVDDRMDVGRKHPENLLVIAPYHPKEKNQDDDASLLYLANILQKAISDYRLYHDKEKRFSSFLYSPLTEKCVYRGKFYYGVKTFSSEEELRERIRTFQRYY